MTLTPHSSIPHILKSRRSLTCLGMLLLGIVMLGGEGSVVKASADQDHDNDLRFLDPSHQGLNTSSSSSNTRAGLSDQEPLAFQSRQKGGRIVGEVEFEMVQAEPLYRPTHLHPHAVLTSAISVLPQNPRSFSDLYFDENRRLMGERKSGILEKIVQILRDEPESTLFVNAYCDERGAAAYSLMLGDRHAHQVQTYFMHLGLPPDRISPLSFGEAKVWCQEQSAQCWEENLLLKGVFRLMAPNDPRNGCLIRLALTAGSHGYSPQSQIHRSSPLQRLRVAHSP